MNYFILFFQSESGGASMFTMLIPMAAIFAIFYFLVIRPQKRQQEDLKQLVQELKINDEVVTNGGIIGKIKEVRENSFIIQSAEKSFIEVGKSAVVGKKQ